MVRITRVYTRKGDTGTTRLSGPKQFAKNSLRITVIGDIDELNSFLGFVTVALTNEFRALKQNIIRIQNELFELGAQLATTSGQNLLPHINQNDIVLLEKEIDAMNEELPSLTSFILPGGHEFACRLHLARTVCRRAERNITALVKQEQLPGNEIAYTNRLSDWLFVAARFVNHQLGCEEQLWIPRSK